MSGQEPTAIVRERLAKYHGDNYKDGWEELWSRGDVLPWDRGFPNPALEDTLTQGRALLGKPVETTENGIRRKKALVPGCGRGVDVLLLASFGYDAYGLEYSAAAVEACKEEEAKSGDKYPVRDPEIGRGTVTFIQGDFFQDDWLEKIGVPRNSFHLVYDYTVFITQRSFGCLPLITSIPHSIPYSIPQLKCPQCSLCKMENELKSDRKSLPLFLPGL